MGRKNRNLFGFTLLEIMIVVSIIAILAALGLTTYAALNRNSRDARRRGDLEQIRLALEQYRSNNSAYPTPIPGGFGMQFGTGALTDSQNTYLQRIPQDPRGSQSYYYTVITGEYTVASKLEGTASCTSIGGTDCDTKVGTQACNYCVGPYGQRP